MIYVLIPLIIIANVFIIGKVNLISKFETQVKELFAQSKSISQKKFSYQQLEGLPAPVQRYFKHVLKEGQSYISYVRLKHEGQFKINLKKGWRDIKCEEYFTTEKPGFIWKGKATLVTVSDSYISDKGRFTASLFAAVRVITKKDEQYNKEALLRWLGESILFPTNLLPSERLQWTAIDDNSAQLDVAYKGLVLMYLIKFNDKGEIVELETKKRSMDKNKLETFIIRPTQYEERNGIVIPIRAEALWRLKEGDFSYAKFNITAIEYDKPEKF